MGQAQEKQASLRAGLRDLMQDHAQRVLVLRCGIAGLSYHIDTQTQQGEELRASLTVGTPLKLYRDPQNEHDSWAVGVYTADEQLIGFITRYKNETIARMMDAGKRFSAVVEELDDEALANAAPTEDPQVPIAVYLEEDGIRF